MRGGSINRLEDESIWRRKATAGSRRLDLQNWRDSAQEWEKRAEHAVIEHPQVVIAAAAVAGLLLGWMVKRR